MTQVGQTGCKTSEHVAECYRLAEEAKTAIKEGRRCYTHGVRDLLDIFENITEYNEYIISKNPDGTIRFCNHWKIPQTGIFFGNVDLNSERGYWK